MTHKYCTYCKDYHKVSEFRSHPTGRLGLHPRCNRARYWMELERRAKVNGSSSIDDVIALSNKIKEEPSVIPEVKRVLSEEAKHLLTWREQQVLSLRYEGWTLKKIGKKLGLSRERVRQIQKQAEYALSPDARHDVEFSHFTDRPIELSNASHVSVIPFVRLLMKEYSATNGLIFEPILQALIERTKNATKYKDEWFGICEELVAFMK